MTDSAAMAALHAELRACRLCVLAGHAITEGPVFSGHPGASVMLIGQAPGITEGEVKRPFNASSGRRLFKWLADAGWSEDEFRGRHYMTAVTKCYPGPNTTGKGDRVPSRAEQALCRPWLEREIRLVNPRLLILVGGLAIKLLYPASTRLDTIIGTAVWFPPASLAADPLNLEFAATEPVNTPEDVARYAAVKGGRFVVPLPHPSGASLWLNKPEHQALVDKAIALLDEIRESQGL